MSRRSETSPDAGTDSLLDVLANLVGILVILVVVTAARVGTPPAAPDPAADAAPAVAAPDPAVAAPVEPVPPAPVERSPALLAGIEAAERERDALLADLRHAADRTSETSDAAVVLRARLAALRDEAVVLRNAADTDRTAADAARAEADRLAAAASDLGVRLERANAPVRTELAHRRPLGRSVERDELHFRVRGGRVSRVPIGELTARLKADLPRRRSAVVRSGRWEGEVGPVLGYSMRYVLERLGSSLGDPLSLQPGTRYGVTGWVLVDGPGVPEETVDAALRPGSFLQLTLRQAAAGMTLTFWVYPDDFAAFRRLRDAAVAAGYEVAARPLPAGVPITGSPGGSKSLAQ